MLEQSDLSVEPRRSADVLEEERAPADAPRTATLESSSLLEDLSNDDAWAKPKKRTNRRLTVFTAVLVLALFGLGTFIAGAKMAKGSSGSTGGAGRRTGAFGGLGGTGGIPAGIGGAGGFPAGGFPGRGSGATGGSTSSGATTAGAAALNDLLNGTATATGPAIQGKVTAIDSNSITVTKDDGTTAVITLDAKATFARRTNTTAGDIKIGDNVAAEGTADTAGNVAATAVTVGDLAVPSDATESEATPATGSDLGGLLGG